MRRPKTSARLQSRKKNTIRRRRIVLFIIVAVILLMGLGWWGFAQNRRYSQAQAGQPVQSGPNEDFTQFSPDVPLYTLLIGVDDNDPQQTNFVALMAINTAKKHVDFIMLPDNTKIEGRKEKGSQKLSEIYSEGGLKLTQAVVEDIFHMPIPFYAVVTENAFKEIVNQTDGISMYVERDMYHEDGTGITDIDLNQGYQYLTGEQALGYVRYIDKNGNLPRTQRQERFVKLFYGAMQQQHFGFVNMYRAYRLWQRVDSNISAKDIAKLSYAFKDVPVADISFYILPGEMVRSRQIDYWNMDPVEVQKIVGNANNAIVSDDTSAAGGTTKTKTN